MFTFYLIILLLCIIKSTITLAVSFFLVHTGSQVLLTAHIGSILFSKRKHIFPGVCLLFTNLCCWLYSSFHTLIAVIEKWIILSRERKGEACWRDSTPQDKCMRDPSFGTVTKSKEKKAGERREGDTWCDVFLPPWSVWKVVSAVSVI